MNFDVKLTKREEEVMDLVFLGLSDKEIPERLSSRSGSAVSVNTIRNIIANIKEKISANHRTELSLWWAIKKYHISVDWTPLRRKICAAMMLVLLVPQFIFSQGDMIRSRRSGGSGRTFSSRGRSRRSREESLLELEAIGN